MPRAMPSENPWIREFYLTQLIGVEQHTDGKEYLDFNYMGSSEFEWGSIPCALARIGQWIQSADHIRSKNITIKCYDGDWEKRRFAMQQGTKVPPYEGLYTVWYPKGYEHEAHIPEELDGDTVYSKEQTQFWNQRFRIWLPVDARVRRPDRGTVLNDKENLNIQPSWFMTRGCGLEETRLVSFKEKYTPFIEKCAEKYHASLAKVA